MESIWVTKNMSIKLYKALFIVIGLLLMALPTYAQVINAGVGGNTTGNLLMRVDMDVLEQNPDLIILMVGTNDMLNSKKMVSYSEYATNLQVLVKKMANKNSKVVLMSSPPVDSAYLFTRHDRNLFTDAPNKKIDSIGLIVKQVASNHGVYFYHLNSKFKELNLPQHNQDLFIKNERNSSRSDGVHPTALGYRFIAENIFTFLDENELLKPEIKIVCFGDSITQGSGADENYPFYLGQRIENYSTKN